MTVQLPLGITLRDDASLANFLAGGNGEACQAAVELSRQALPRDRLLYLWGGVGVGKSHLLQAICHAAADNGLATAYVPLAMADELTPEMLDDLDSMDVVCIDDVDRIAERREWEMALFAFYNRARDGCTRLAVTADAAPAGLPLALPDLRSRFGAGLVYHLEPLTDGDKLSALQLRARRRGLELNAEVGQFLLRRCPRDMPALFATLERLDRASLAAQRRLTIPFVKEVLRA